MLSRLCIAPTLLRSPAPIFRQTSPGERFRGYQPKDLLSQIDLCRLTPSPVRRRKGELPTKFEIRDPRSEIVEAFSLILLAHNPPVATKIIA